MTTITLLSLAVLLAALAVSLPVSIGNLRALRRRNADLAAWTADVASPAGDLVDVATAQAAIASTQARAAAE